MNLHTNDPKTMDIDITQAMTENFMAYASAVVGGRAIPHAADGLKPVHRRSLYVMRNLANTTYKKSARVVGEILGKYHPHGDSALYEAIVRMAQPFSMRYPLIDGQGNFGSIDGDSAAAMRYTEVKLTPIAELLLKNTADDVVDYTLNYDGTEQEPELLGAGFPNLLVNGSDGIAVGIATSIPPHNLSDIVDATVELIRDPGISVHHLARIVSAPDFPTGGTIMGIAGAYQAYLTGKGKVTLRAKTHFEELDNGQVQIVFTELPYRVNKASLFIRIGELIRDGVFTEISELRDESSGDIRGIILLKRGQNPDIVLARLFAETQLQVNVPINLVALKNNGQPKLFDLKELLSEYITHRRRVLFRHTEKNIQRLKKKIERLNAENAVNREIINLVHSARDYEQAISLLTNPETGVYESPHEDDPEPAKILSRSQAEHILGMTLNKLTIISKQNSRNEQAACLDELTVLKRRIELVTIIDSSGNRNTGYHMLDEYMIEDLLETKAEVGHITRGDARMSDIGEEAGNFVDEDFIDNKPMVVTLTRSGYIKVTDAENYQAQNRGGTGKLALSTKDNDSVYLYANAMAHDYLFIVTSLGRIYSPKVHRLPAGERTSRGKPIINVVDLKENETITAMIPVSQELRSDDAARFVFASKFGQIKSVSAKAFMKIRDGGVNAVTLQEDDCIVSVKICRANDDIILISANGLLARYPENTIRVSLRGSGMVRGIRLAEDDYLVAMEVSNNTAEHPDELLIVTSAGIGKITPVNNFRSTSSRGTMGVRATKLTEPNEVVVGVMTVTKSVNEVMLLSSIGKLICVSLDEISRMSRNAHGVKLINLSDGEFVVAANLTI